MTKKVLHIITRLDKGGSAQNTLLTVRGLSQITEVRRQKSEDRRQRTEDRRQKSDYRLQTTESNWIKYKVTLVTGSVSDVDISDINVVIIPELGREINPVVDIVCLFKLYKFIKEGRFDIVHTHSSKAGFLGRIAAKLAGVATIFHTPHGHIFYGYFNSYITQIFILLERFAAKFTDRIISLTDSETWDYIKFRIAPKEKFLTIHSGIKIERFMNTKVNKIEKLKELGIIESPVVISVARLVPIKGHKYLIDAASRVVRIIPNVKFLLVGGGHLREKLEKQVQHLSIRESVLFLDEREDVPELLACADIFTICSLNEGMGRAIVEAMAAGLPVVATKVCGIPDVVEDGVTGILVPPKDPVSLSMTILKLLKDRELAKKMGEEGRKRARMFGVEEMVSKIENLYEELMRSKK